MKLILKQYLASLNERSELDAVLPDLLSKMGFNVFISPTRGVKEYGVDIAAIGSMNGGTKNVYLFSVKSGNLTRSTWNGTADQALRPSLDEILDSFIPNRLPSEHRNKPLVICLCFGGDVNSGIRQEVSGYQQRNTRDGLTYEEWNGDKLSELILDHLLKEELLPKNWQSMLRKSLALLDESEASHVHFKKLTIAILDDNKNDETTRNAVNRVNLCLWILFSWCREDNNLESAFLSAEFAMLNAWENVKIYSSNRVLKAFASLHDTYQIITDEYVNKCLIPHVDFKHAISHAVKSPCSIDVNLKLFDLLGRLALKGLWVLDELTKSYEISSCDSEDNSKQTCLRKRLDVIETSIKKLIINNPLLLSPYKDSQAIDLALALNLLSQDSENDIFIVSWLKVLVDKCTFLFATNGMYPTTLETYEQLLEHQHKDKEDDKYKIKVSQGSILYPLLSLYCGLYKVEDASKQLKEFVDKNLEHCTLQYWYPNQLSEKIFYLNSDMHGAASTNFPIDAVKTIDHVAKECQESNFFWQLSAVKKGYLPLIFLACRHYRYPVPFHVLEDYLDIILQDQSKTKDIGCC